MTSASTSTAGLEGPSITRKPSTLTTAHRSPHSHSGSGAGLWLANTPSPDTSAFAEPPSTRTDSVSFKDDESRKVYHFSADLARTSFGGRPLTLVGSADFDPIYANKRPAVASDDGDVDLDLSFDYISRFDRSSSSEQQDSSGTAFDSSRETGMLTSQFSPDDTPESLQAPGNHTATVGSSLMPAVTSSSSSGSLSSSTNSSVVRSMQANATWDKRRKAPPAPLTLTPQSSQRARPPQPSVRPPSQQVGQSAFSPVTPGASTSAAFMGDFGAPPALPVTPLSATRRGASINRIPETTPGREVRRTASTSTSNEALRRTPTATTPLSATPVAKRARSHSNRSFRASASLASLGPPPFPPPTEPLPSPLAVSPSFPTQSSAYNTANDATTVPRSTQRSSLDSFRTAASDGLPMTTSSRSVHDRRWASDDAAPPLPPLQRYEAIFGNWTTSSSGASSQPMAFSNTLASTASTGMTWSMSDRSTPSMSPLTPFTPAFPDSAKTTFTRPPSEVPLPTEKVVHPAMSLGGAGATLQEADERGERDTEQWIRTQRSRKAMAQHEELASHARLLEANQQAVRLSIRASHIAPAEDKETRERQDTESTDDEHVKRHTMVISTASTPEERSDPFGFVAGQPSLMERANTHNELETASKMNLPMTRNRSGTTGPWAQSPLLLNFQLPPPTTQNDNEQEKVIGLGLDLNFPASQVEAKQHGFAPITTDLLRQASRVSMRQQEPDAPSPHLAIQMSPEAKLHRKRSKSKEVLLTRGPAAKALGPDPNTPAEVTVNRAQVLHPSQSVASTISAFTYNATPAPADGSRPGVKPKTIAAHRSRESLLNPESKFVSVDLNDAAPVPEAVKIEGARPAAAPWVSKLWTAVASPRQASGDRSIDLEQANSSSSSRDRVPSRTFRPLSLVEKRQSSGRFQARERFRSPTPGEEDEVAEKDARAVALRLLAGSPRIPPPLDEDKVVDTAEESMDRSGASAEEREKERVDALKKLRRMSAMERQKKRNSGIGYITSTPAVVESRLPYVHDESREEPQDAAAVRHGGFSRVASMNRKRMSMGVFGGKERMTTLPVPEQGEDITGAPEHAWFDAMRSPMDANSPAGFTPRMAFEARQPAGASTVNHIPLMLAGSATAARPAPSAADHGLTLSELDRARDEMRRLASQGMAFNQAEYAEDAAETFHTPVPDMAEGWAYAGEHDAGYYAEGVDFHDATQPTTELNDFGISPEKKETRLHRRTRTARFADDDYHHHYEQDHPDDQPTVSIFTRPRHGVSSSVHLPYHSHGQAPQTEHRSRSKRRAAAHAAGHGLFATPASLLDSATPSKNMFWAGFLGMPWLWMIGGWYLTPDGQLRHPSSDSPKTDVWQHEPSMPPPNFGSTTFASTQESWGLPGMPSHSYLSTGTTGTAQSTSTDPSRPPPSRVRKSKTRSFGALLDSNPEVSFYASPVRVVQEPPASFGGVWRGNMTPLMEEEPARRSRLFAGYPGEFSPDAAKASPMLGYQTAMASKQGWKDLERYVLLNRLAALLSGVLVFAGFTGAVYAVVTNF
ncbi:hypothetical protein PSEUBRA_000713 [Kalmanozyma brasiliensis GHG001]|uniref:Uncharacterized protein n=1 Tax=Kalmanozyma brasiliensis (strain GHG001) TaxID=1365824 RepID=V5EVI4_KALBG|nr:uncharacterized protein PSEUBRA_000713 [Kalmanozyma brasiliensis GHG001]EST09500.1 hypothetical protein PSEUBRA_000713 [Kalmanozyma brasiliensis GHG001]